MPARNQTKFQEEMGQSAGFIQSASSGQSLGGGYCAGVCLDWARRVLLSPQTRSQSFLNYGYDAMKEGRGTKDGRTLQASQERSFASVGRMGQAWVAHNAPDFWARKPGETSDEVSRATWDTKAAGLAAQHQKGKAFTNMVLLGSKSSVYNNGLAWMTDLMDSGLRPGAVSKVGFGRVGSGGHAVAVWQRKATRNDPDSFYFFDPNYGVFSCNEVGVKAMFKILFYRTLNDTPRYERCASHNAQRMNYLIFGPPNVVGAGVVPSMSAPVHSAPPRTSAPVTQPASANAYSPAAHSLPTSPGRSSAAVTTPEPAVSPLKALLMKELSETARHVATFGTHPKVAGGYVKISHKLKTDFEADPPTSSPVIVRHSHEHAMAKRHMEQVIAML
jgi:hypothetical protein